jgi:two-component system alkaline phosphatase synthesis response regulator PhoP
MQMDSFTKKILIIDDEESVHDFLSFNLQKDGFKVFSAKNGSEGILLAKKHLPNIILLDVMMPEQDGVMTCIELRKEPKLNKSFIVFLTARGEDYSQMAGYDAGADDYIKKPISPKVLVAKLNSMLRRNHNYENEINTEEKILNRGKLTIDKEKFIVIVDKKEINLPRKEFELLIMLATKPEKVFTRDEIFNKIWGENNESGYRTIDVHVRKLREKLGGDFIRTQKGVGYRFQDDLTMG